MLENHIKCSLEAGKAGIVVIPILHMGFLVVSDLIKVICLASMSKLESKFCDS